MKLEPVPETSPRLKDAVAAFEKEHIEQVLKSNQGNKEATAKILDISLSSLYRKIDELEVEI
ncbi:MAG: helix-turn-helix domain-containing protein [Calditrichota bacterium]